MKIVKFYLFFIIDGIARFLAYFSLPLEYHGVSKKNVCGRNFRVKIFQKVSFFFFLSLFQKTFAIDDKFYDKSIVYHSYIDRESQCNDIVLKIHDVIYWLTTVIIFILNIFCRWIITSYFLYLIRYKNSRLVYFKLRYFFFLVFKSLFH